MATFGYLSVVTFYVLLLLICNVLSCLLLGRWRLVVRWMSREIRSLPCQLRSSSQIIKYFGCRKVPNPPSRTHLTKFSNGNFLPNNYFCQFVSIFQHRSMYPERGNFGVKKKKQFHIWSSQKCSLSKKKDTHVIVVLHEKFKLCYFSCYLHIQKFKVAISLFHFVLLFALVNILIYVNID